MNIEVIIAVSSAVITSVIGPVAVHYAKTLIDKYKSKKDPLSEAISINSTISEKLEAIRSETNADRIWLLQFHNGGHFYPTGKSIQKFSMVQELTKPGIVPCQSQFQNIPVSLFSKTVNALHQGSVVEIPNTKSPGIELRGLTTEIQGAGVKSTYIFPIFNIKEEFVAIVGIDYVGKTESLSKQKVLDTEVDITTIGGVLHNYLKV